MASINGGSGRSSHVPFLSVLSIFLAANLIASSLNHIDDTDETYGYYEPLHYLLYGVGMQTWEYSPLYAIRTYTFITPFWGMCSVLKLFRFSKLNIFFGIRIILGITTALSETHFVSAVYENYGRVIGNFTFFFTLFSSGILYCSTALLPSAVIMSLVMIASASWLRHQYSLTIFLGCISVLWSGWPFAGVIFVPFGLHMLVDTYSSSTDAEGSTYSNLKRVSSLAIRGATILGLVLALSLAVDFFMYSKRTFPTWNILAYNAIGGSGDELYGVEPVSYYIRNLTLNMSISWPLAVAAPILWLRETMYSLGSISEKTVRTGVLILPSVLWLGILFSRPHKEERFVYPVYPLLAFMAAFALSSMIDMVCDLCAALLGDGNGDGSSSTSLDSRPSSGGAPNSAATGNKKWERLRRFLIGGCVSVTFILCSSRSISNYTNYRGYLSLWTLLGEDISLNFPDSSDDNYSLPGTAARTISTESKPVTVCIGGEWYTFPSHFFLPKNARLEYVRGNFHGQLPYHFSSINGTSTSTVQRFNDKNEEEESRYVMRSTCDYLVANMDLHSSGEEEIVEKEGTRSGSWRARIGHFIQTQTARGDETGDDKGKSRDFDIPDTDSDPVSFRLLFSRRIIDPALSSSSIARAYFIPGLSSMKNAYSSYSALKRN